MSRFQCIAFDLDDTLLDTQRLLVPTAARESAQAMIDAGLDSDLARALAARESLFRENPRLPPYERMVARLGARPGADPEAVAEAGRRAFLGREVDPGIRPIPEAERLLGRLSAIYKLYLVTSGDSVTQMRKVEILGIAGRFKAVFAVDPSRGERKGQAFASILRSTGLAPDACLSVGNRVDTDLAEAKDLGWKTCWVRQGEYVHLNPETPSERPDFRIDRIDELIAACGL